MTPLTSPLMRGERGGARPHEGEKRERKILIIGSKGTLGQALVSEFSRDHDVVAVDRDELDITDKEQIASTLSPAGDLPKGDNLVINAAAYTDVDGAESNEERTNQINGYAVGNLARACKEMDIPIVHYSTDYVFDGENQDGYKEDDEPSPINAYGQSKFLGERELRKNTDKFYLIRLSRLFGKATSPALRAPSPGLGRGRGEVEPMRKRSFVDLMLDLAKTKSEIDAVDEELSSPTYAPDLAARTRYIIEQNLPYDVYHAANSGSCTWYGFAREIFKITGKNVRMNPVPASHFPRPAKRPKYAVLLNTKLPEMRNWKQALREYLT